jgi:hypothetical protein
MSNANHTGSFQAAQRYRRAAFGSIVVGVLALFAGVRVGYDLAGLVVYALAALTGVGILAYVRLSDSLAMGDERLCELERRASHYSVVLLGGLGWVVLVGLALLEAAGQRAMTATEETLLWAFFAFFLVWAAIYVVLRFRR